MHLDLEDAVALARLAATALDVEAEAAGLVAAHARLTRLAEELADRVEDARVRRRIRARRAADRLVDVDDLVDVLESLDLLVLARLALHVVEARGDALVEDLVNERRLARARDARDERQRAERELDRQVLEVVLGGADDLDELARAWPALRGDRDELAAREIGACDGVGILLDLLGRSLCDDAPAVRAGARTDVDDVVGRVHRVLIVFDDDQRIAEVAQVLERREQAVVVALVQADARLVEDVEDALQPRADLRRKADALCLAAGKRSRRARKRQVVEPDIQEELQPRVDLLEDLARDLRLALCQRQLQEEIIGLADRHARDFVDVLAADGDRERLRLEARAMACLAGDLGHVVLVRLAHLVTVRLVVAAREQRHDALERHEVLLVLAEHVRVAELEALLAGAVEQDLLRLLVEFLPRRLEAVAAALEDGFHHTHRVGVQVLRERRKDAPAHAQPRIREDELFVELHVAAESRADGAGAVGIVEREHARREFRQADAAVHAGKVLAEHQELAIHDLHISDALAELQCRLEGVGQARLHALAHDEAVDDDLDRVLLVLLELDVLTELHDLAVDAHAHISLMADVRENLLVLALLAAHDLRHDEQLRALRQCPDLVNHLVDGLLCDGLAALRAVRMPHAREEQSEVVVDLGDRADGRARVMARRLLVD